MITCALCGRSLLVGEAFQHFRADGAVGSEVPVCRLCEEDAEAEGWARVERAPQRQTTVGPHEHVRKVA